MAGFKRPRHVYVTSQPLPRLSSEAKVARGLVKRTVGEWVASTAQVPDGVTKVVQVCAPNAGSSWAELLGQGGPDSI